MQTNKYVTWGHSKSFFSPVILDDCYWPQRPTSERASEPSGLRWPSCLRQLICSSRSGVWRRLEPAAPPLHPHFTSWRNANLQPSSKHDSWSHQHVLSLPRHQEIKVHSTISLKVPAGGLDDTWWQVWQAPSSSGVRGDGHGGRRGGGGTGSARLDVAAASSSSVRHLDYFCLPATRREPNTALAAVALLAEAEDEANVLTALF